MKLDQLISAAREDAPAFEPAFERVAARHERRRVVRRSLGAASAVAIVALVLLRAGSSSADAHVDEPNNVVAAASHDGDGGDYAHD